MKLVLAPFQGPVACTRNSKGRGMWCKLGRSKTLIRPDVEKFPGHIAAQFIKIRNCCTGQFAQQSCSRAGC